MPSRRNVLLLAVGLLFGFAGLNFGVSAGVVLWIMGHVSIQG